MYMYIGELSVWVEIILFEINDFLEVILINFFLFSYELSINVFWIRVLCYFYGFYWKFILVLMLGFFGFGMYRFFLYYDLIFFFFLEFICS